MNSEPKYQPQQELENLQQKYNALQQLYQKKVDEQNISVRQITDVIESNPIPIQIVDKNGYTLLINDAFKALFGANPPKDYSVFNDIQVERLGYSNLFDDLKAGHAIKFPDIAYNAHNTNSNFHNTTIWVRTQAFPLADAQGIPDRFIFIHQDISEVKENEQALRESEEKYRLLLELAPDAFFHGNENGNFILVNKKASIFTGYTKDELMKMNMKSLFSTSELNLRPLRYDRLNGGDIVTSEREIVRKDGSTVIVEMVSQKMPSNTYLSFMRDISERKKAEAALQKSEHLYRTIFENTGTASIIIDEDTTITLSNSEWLNLSGYSRDEMDGKMQWTQFAAPEDLIRMKEYHKIRRVKPNEAPHKYEFRLIRRNGEIRNMINFVAMFPDSSKSIASMLDITELKQLEEVRRESEGKFKTIVETSPDGIVISSLNGVVQFINGKATAMWGYDSALEVISKNVIELVDKKDQPKAIQFISDIGSGRPTDAAEFLMTRNDGKTFYCESSASLLYDASNQPTGILYISRNISLRKQIEIELIKAKEKAEESDRLKSAFLANMSHEIRTPMNGILGFAGLLKQPQLSGDQQKEYISIIEKSGTRMLNIINDIIDISKIESGQVKINLSPTNVEEQLNYLFKFFRPEAEKKGLSLILSNEALPRVITIHTDREKVYAILTNLIKNAIKFTDNGSVEFGYSPKEDFLEFYVRDTGIGIPSNRQQAIFERFVQADINDKRVYQGAGLGLSITKAFIEILGGKIWVESEEQKGSTFYFTIPIGEKKRQTEPLDNAGANKTKSSNLSKLNVLIAEDDEASDMLITLTLKESRYNILHVKSGLDAVITCRNNSKIDIIFMDIKMPDMDGFEATRQIRQFNKKVIIIAQTAYALSGDKEKAIQAGCNNYIAKPINHKHLTELVDAYFGTTI